MSKTYDLIKKLDDNLGYCLRCDIKEGCDLLQSLYGIDICDTLKLIDNPKEYRKEFFRD